MPNFAMMRLLVRLYAADGDGAAGGGGAGAAAGGGGAGAAAGGGAGGAADGGEAGKAGAAGDNPFGRPGSAAGEGAKGGDVSGAYFPEKFPEHLRGTNDRETIDKLFGAYSGAREEMSRRGAVPKEPGEYQLALPEEVAKVLGNDLSKDRSAQIYRTIAHKHGLTDKQASGVFSDFMAEQMQAGLIQTVDPLVEARKIIGNEAAGLSGDQVFDKAAERWSTLQDRIGGLVANKTISESMAAVAKQFTNTADGVLLLEAMFGRMGEHGMRTGGSQGQGTGITKADIDKRWNDPRSNALSPLYDKAFADETDRLAKGLFGEKSAA